MKCVALGANNPETIRVVHSIRKVRPEFEFLGFIDNNEALWGTEFRGFPVFGGVDKVPELARQGAGFVNLITRDCVTRYETTLEMCRRGARLVNLIHPSVDLELVTLGVGLYVQENVVLQADVSVGDNASIHIGTLVGHETSIGCSAFIAHGCNLSGCITIEDGVFMGTGVSVVPRVRIGKWSVIGAGTTVIKDVPPYSVVVGSPGRVVKTIEPVHATGAVR